MSLSTIFNITKENFNQKAMEVFHFQAKNNLVYKKFIELLEMDSTQIEQIKDIPFLPISFFKTHTIVSNKQRIQQTFYSSGTTGDTLSKHHLTDLGIYQNSYNNGFTHFYGNIEEYTVLALLPNYLEREGSSLVYMVADLIKKTKKKQSGFYLNNLEELTIQLKELDKQGEKILLIGVSFALLDLLDVSTFTLQHTIIMETGGMKGRRKEIIRDELHALLKKGFGVDTIHSEYGMTELLSQAYSFGNGIFITPPWMKILIRDTEDALSLLPHQKAGGINIIDLANSNSCAFIATQDLGKTYKDNQFEILGRFDNSDIRGCNLMVI